VEANPGDLSAEFTGARVGAAQEADPSQDFEAHIEDTQRSGGRRADPEDVLQ